MIGAQAAVVGAAVSDGVLNFSASVWLDEAGAGACNTRRRLRSARAELVLGISILEVDVVALDEDFWPRPCEDTSSRRCW